MKEMVKVYIRKKKGKKCWKHEKYKKWKVFILLGKIIKVFVKHKLKKFYFRILPIFFKNYNSQKIKKRLLKLKRQNC